MTVEPQITELLTARVLAMAEAGAMLALGVFLVMRVLARLKWLERHPWAVRALPLLPEALGVAGALLGGIAFDPETPVVVRAIYGLMAGAIATRAHKLLGQTILGDDKRIAAPKKRRTP